MNKNLKSINESERNINWEEVEYKVSIICQKFNNIDPRYRDDLAQELRIHAYYKSDDYYDLMRKAVDFWRTLQVRVMPEVPYFDLELLGGVRSDETSVTFEETVRKISNYIKSEHENVSENIRKLAVEIFEIILDDVVDRDPKVKIRQYQKYKPYHNSRISCSYLWEVMGDDVGSINYKDIRKALKYIESAVKILAEKGDISVDEIYLD